MMYEFDVFISYPNEADHKLWVREYFLRKFRFFLKEDLGREPRIFLDEKSISTGTEWPRTLEHALGRSIILVAVWSVEYFDRDWCNKECAIMYYRQMMLNQVEGQGPYTLLLPIRFGDGKNYPRFAQDLQQLDCSEFNNVGPAFDKTPEFLRFGQKIKEWTPEVAQFIKTPPPFDPQWQTRDWVDSAVRLWEQDDKFRMRDSPYEVKMMG